MTRNQIIILAIVFLLIIAGIIFLNKKDTTPTKPAEQLQSKVDTTSKDSSPSADLKIEDIKVGTGREVKSGDTISIHYTGTLTDGTKFDSSIDRGQPFQTQIGVGEVIKGWDQGVIGMKVGGKRKLIIPPSLGYGSRATGPIPANSTLIFELELLDIKN